MPPSEGAVTPRAAAVRSRPKRVRQPVSFPPILLEGDLSVASAVSGPGDRFALGPTPTPEARRAVVRPEGGELPSSYGTERLFLMARDPHWLYAAWDMTPERQQHYNALSAEGRLTLRVHEGAIAGRPVAELPVDPEARSWFVSVPKGGVRYQAQLGYQDGQGLWNVISTSAQTVTPPEAVSADTSVEFATIPPTVTLKSLFSAVQEAVSESEQLREAVQESVRASASRPEPVQEIGKAARPTLPPALAGAIPQWTPERAQALAEVVRLDETRRVWVGSLEVTELVRRHLGLEITSPAPAEGIGAAAITAARPGEGGEIGISSVEAAGERAPGRPGGFWLNVNAELVIYGATDPEARVSVGGRAIRLRPDGTFSYRFALPDGQYPLLIEATAPDDSERRTAKLSFSRSTKYQGDVGVHPQDARLKTVNQTEFS